MLSNLLSKIIACFLHMFTLRKALRAQEPHSTFSFSRIDASLSAEREREREIQRETQRERLFCRLLYDSLNFRTGPPLEVRSCWPRIDFISHQWGRELPSLSLIQNASMTLIAPVSLAMVDSGAQVQPLPHPHNVPSESLCEWRN